jgi:TIR domain
MSAEYLFVCHVSEDRPVALEVVEELERRGVRCWIAPRDVRPGMPFDDEIADAIEDSSAMLLIFSERCNEKQYIRREVTVAGESKKLIIPFRIETRSRNMVCVSGSLTCTGSMLFLPGIKRSMKWSIPSCHRQGRLRGLGPNALIRTRISTNREMIGANRIPGWQHLKRWGRLDRRWLSVILRNGTE